METVPGRYLAAHPDNECVDPPDADERCVIVRYDPDLADAFGNPAECRITYRHVAGADPVMVVTFGRLRPSGDIYAVMAAQMRAQAGAPFYDGEDDR